ncbi:carbonic anhydrase [Streptomyces cellulosae]|uniref:carbonic anhydrase n=1 Tax=Streptomyces TaxID=1883 RepID=UPI002250DCAE|nr:carbonic anhydrase [Streptomyces sp. OS603R]MCX4481588.1 carbonic anhydrase [Streptomyces cellulosae]WTC54944.1 carbonic anhydrase [Streptomyces cellulosae]
MQYLIDQARVFRARAAAHTLDLGGLARYHYPRAMFIACSDARIVPALLTAARPGDLFELRTYGGVIPPYDPTTPTSESRTIEYAVTELGVSDIIVCGHSHCDVVTAELHDNLATSGITESDDEVTPLTGDLTAAGHWYVLTQVDALSDYPCVVPRLADRSLRLHAWFHEIDTGATLAHHPRANTFLPL